MVTEASVMTPTELPSERQRVRELGAEVDRLKAWIADLQAGMYVACVYCGHRLAGRDAASSKWSDALRAHIETCSQHPASKLKVQLEAMTIARDRACNLAEHSSRRLPAGEMANVLEQVGSLRKVGLP